MPLSDESLDEFTRRLYTCEAAQPLGAAVEQYLSERLAPAGDPDTVFALLLQEVAVRLERGESVSAEEAVSCLRRLLGAAPQCDNLVASLREQLELLETAVAPRGRKLEPGQLVGDYELERCLNQGGMSELWIAWQRTPVLERRVALKTVRLDQLPLSQDERTTRVERFIREARATAALNHPNILPVYEADQRDGVPYFTMRLITGDGVSVRDQLRTEPFDARRTAEIGEQIARALHHAHQHGVVHRDVKPGNILLDANGVALLVDFGLVRLSEESAPAGPLEPAIDPSGSHLTRTRGVLGTLPYAAPEQHDDPHNVSPAADIYSLGVTLYEMVTGELPFRGANASELLQQIRSQAPQPPHLLVPGIPVNLETIILRCLNKLPEQRYASAAEVGDDLANFLKGKPIVAEPPFAGEFVKERWRELLAPYQPLTRNTLARCKELSLELSTTHPREVEVLLRALDCGAVNSLMSLADTESERASPKQLQDVASVLSCLAPMSGKEANWAVQTWFEILPEPDAPLWPRFLLAGGCAAGTALGFSWATGSVRVLAWLLGGLVGALLGGTIRTHDRSRILVAAEAVEGVTGGLLGSLTGALLGWELGGSWWMLLLGSLAGGIVGVGGHSLGVQRLKLWAVVAVAVSILTWNLGSWIGVGLPQLLNESTVDFLKSHSVIVYMIGFGLIAGAVILTGSVPENIRDDRGAVAVMCCVLYLLVRIVLWVCWGENWSAGLGGAMCVILATALVGGMIRSFENERRDLQGRHDLTGRLAWSVPRLILFALSLGWWWVYYGEQEHRYDADGKVDCLTVAPDGAIVAGIHEARTERGLLEDTGRLVSFDRSVAVWAPDGSRWQRTQHFEGNVTSIHRVAVMSEKDLHDLVVRANHYKPADLDEEHLEVEPVTGVLTSGPFDPVRGWIWTFRKEPPRFPPEERPATDQLRVLCVTDGVDLFDLKDGSPDGRVAIIPAEVRTVGLHPGLHQLFLSPRNTSITRLDDQGKVLPKDFYQSVNGFACSPDRRLIVLAERIGFTARVYAMEARTGHSVVDFSQNGREVTCLAWSADGRWVLSGSTDRAVRLWDAETGRLVRRWCGHWGPVTTVAFTPDSRTAISGSDDRTIRKWRVPS
jgi:serine/threonine protein kinase